MSLMRDILTPGSVLGDTVFNWILIFIVALIVIVFVTNVVDKIEGFFGVSSKASLQKKVDQQAVVIKTEQTVNKDMAITIEQNKKSATAVSTAIVKNYADTKAIKNLAVNTDIKRERTIITINQKAIDTKEDPAITANKISITQINSIWTTYCSFNTEPRCTAFTGG